MSPAARWRILQVADSAFPTGGFAHSGGLEASVTLGHASTPAAFADYVEAHVWNVGCGALPFVGAAHDDPLAVARLDLHLDACLVNRVTNAASRTQGRAFIATCERAFDETALAPLAARARRREGPSHLAPLFGAALKIVGAARDDALAAFLHLALRGVTSAAVRLGVVGPFEAARLTSSLAPTLDRVLAVGSSLTPDEAASTAPVIDIIAATHDRLDARLFQS
jgi:urease accessory protein